MGNYSMYSWVRQGLGQAIGQTFSSVRGQEALGNPAISISAKLADSTTGEVQIYVLGPNDVNGIDPRQVIRTDPAPFTTNFEPNNFPLVEFDRPDLPWLFSPFKAEGNNQLLPWICLVTVEKNDGVLVPPSGDQKLPVLMVDNPSVQLPDPSEAWAWAHAQVLGNNQDILSVNPEANLSRLVCPIKLEGLKQYIACVVPLFHAGVLAGLGHDPAASDRLFAWARYDGGKYRPLTEKLTLPVYYFWEFSTSAKGDFESLVRRLRRIVSSEEFTGTRPVRVDKLLQSGNPEDTLSLEGALLPHDPAKVVPVAPPLLQECGDVLHEAIKNVPDEDLVRPPVYGCWQASRGHGLPAGNGDRTWLKDLNLDPMLRVFASFGTQVVQEQQEQLMSSAWKQVGEIEKANQYLRQAQLARESSKSIFSRLNTLGSDSLFAIAQPMHSRITAKNGKTTHGYLASERNDIAAAASSQFRRLTRPRGPFARRTGAGIGWTGRLIKRVNEMKVSVVPGEIRGKKLEFDPTLSIEESPNMRPYKDFWSHIPQGEEQVRGEPEDLENICKLPDPEITIPKRWKEPRIRPPKGWNPEDPLEPIMAAPDFPQSMYKALCDLSPNLFLPGIENMPNESITALYSNPRYIEAFMVGLNHEMGRELLWRGYPTDQRGTYFRQFWDPSCKLFLETSEADDDTMKDIPLISDWDNRSLGLHFNQDKPEDQKSQVVLLIRGQLLARYPRTIVYLVKAMIDTGTPHDSDNPDKRVPVKDPRYPDSMRDPVFIGTIPPDMTFFGFNISGEDLRGAVGDKTSPGWFFVLEQPPTEVRFGLDVSRPNDPEGLWSDLSQEDINWKNDNPHVFIAGEKDPAPGYGGLKDDFDVTGEPRIQKNIWSLNSNSALFAYMTKQTPVRILIHADDLLDK